MAVSIVIAKQNYSQLVWLFSLLPYNQLVPSMLNTAVDITDLGQRKGSLLSWKQESTTMQCDQ